MRRRLLRVLNPRQSVLAGGLGTGILVAMAEVGIDIASEQPKILTEDAAKESDVVITMGCGDECPYFPGKRYEDWELDDPAGQGVEAVRPIRDEIKSRIENLLADLVPATKQN